MSVGHKTVGGSVRIDIDDHLTSDEITEAIETLTAIRDALENNP